MTAAARARRVQALAKAALAAIESAPRAQPSDAAAALLVAAAVALATTVPDPQARRLAALLAAQAWIDQVMHHPAPKPRRRR